MNLYDGHDFLDETLENPFYSKSMQKAESGHNSYYNISIREE